MKKKYYMLYITIVLLILLIPFAGMSFWATDSAAENRELSEWPELAGEDGWNVEFLSELGAYFEDHLAFRPQMLTVNACVWGKTVKSSTTDQVVIGREGWLYFGGTLDDYTGRDLLSERELYDVVHNLSLMRDYVEQNGGRFLLMIAPNKNTLYDEYMPYYYQEGDTSNLERLQPLLEDAGIAYVDLVSAFEKEEKELYYKRDTHWNNEGAKLAYHTAMEQLGKSHETYLNVPIQIRKDHIGDIDELLYPLAAEEEEAPYYDRTWDYQYVNEVEDHMDAWIETADGRKEGTLLMFRDSFGESLLPFFADEYQNAYFSRLVPYNMENVGQYQPDTVIVERTERKIAAFATEIPIMEGPVARQEPSLEIETNTTLDTRQDGSYLVISGKIDPEYMEDDTQIYVSVSDESRTQTTTYQAFYTLTTDGDGNGYLAYIKKESLPSNQVHINVIIQSGQNSWIVQSKDIEITWDQEEE